jgi:chromosome segregation ATPase
MKRIDVNNLIDETAAKLKREYDYLNDRLNNKDEVIKRMQDKISELQHQLALLDADDLRW